MSNIIFLKPYFKKTPWANENLKKLFNLKENFGEAWLISAVNNCESIVKDYDLILSEFIKKYPNFFALTRQESENFIYPNLTKILDAKYPLSIQVHPDDRYAKQFNSLGKDECWYVLKTSYEPFILGSKTLDINIIKDTINTDQIEQYLNKIKLNEGDFVYIEAGLIHGIPSETMVYELQQSSDITYRLYDYQRLDKDGNKRPIHIKESLDTMKLDLKPTIQKSLSENNFYQTKLFNLTKVELNNNQRIIDTNLAKHCIEVVIIEGEGFIDDRPIKKSDVLLISKEAGKVCIKGKLKLFLNFV
ncbi:type I phosphomannose isomerase catalytic subunit [Mycoplasmopsis cynos]|uniref:type I phosphomannose isomerase catalytic subunit n=1 Tax=Mycoplasmopsis cynos TaxID=171284 RepID=UPI002AFF029D|nr:type I phosphomannose isomerase catalytic subunit [Mycoplasmopsis cynos]WQQ18842.1 type I phosphomannose isomerase catalytic subunit [Mycoplasmopsis cynos]WQQ19304.1 type I phosphomannose isomerase catalytic subunit [Mycoplasmopsis cynos]